MQITKDLMAAYTKHIGLPLTLLDLQGDVKVSINNDTDSIAEEVKQQIIQRQADVKYPIILSVPTKESYDAFYMVTPNFDIQQFRYILVAGPYYLLEQYEHEHAIATQNVADMMEKFKTIYTMFSVKHSVEANLLISKEIIDAVKKIEQMNITSFEKEPIFHHIIDQLIDLHAIDFAGYATYHEEGKYVIRYVRGLNPNVLQGEQFYLGEGILGQAFLNKESFFWQREQQQSYSEFFQRHGVQPEQLFGLPITKGEFHNTIVFGGTFSQHQIHEADLYLLNNLILSLTQQVQWNRETKSFYTTKQLFLECLQIIEQMDTQSADFLALKVLEFCSKLNNQHEILLTLDNGHFITRNKVTNSMEAFHQQFIEQPKLNCYVIQQREALVQFYVQGLGSYSISFKSKSTYYNELMILTTLIKVLAMLKEHNVHNTLIFDQYFEAMVELTPQIAEQVSILLQMVELFVQQELLDTICGKSLTNLLKVLPYSAKFLEKNLLGTIEHNIFKRLSSKEPLPLIAINLEAKFLVFVDEVILQTQHFKQPILSQADYDLFLQIYNEACVQLNAKQKNSKSEKLVLPTLFGKDDKVTQAVEILNLTSREKQVLTLMIEGMSNQQIADELMISAHTVKNHITNIFKKLDVADRYHAMRKVLQI